MLSDVQKLLRYFPLPDPREVLIALYGSEGVIDLGYIVVGKNGKARLTPKGRLKAVTLIRKMFNCWVSNIRNGKKF